MNLAEALNKYAEFYNGVVDCSGVTIAEYDYFTNALYATTEWDEDMERTVFSTNLWGYAIFPNEDNVFIPDYSEQVGVADALEAAGYVTKIRKFTVGPFESPIWEVAVNMDKVTDERMGNDDNE